MGHAGLVAHHGCQVHGLLRVILPHPVNPCSPMPGQETTYPGERLDLSAMAGSALAGEEPERAVARRFVLRVCSQYLICANNPKCQLPCGGCSMAGSQCRRRQRRCRRPYLILGGERWGGADQPLRGPIQLCYCTRSEPRNSGHHHQSGPRSIEHGSAAHVRPCLLALPPEQRSLSTLTTMASLDLDHPPPFDGHTDYIPFEDPPPEHEWPVIAALPLDQAWAAWDKADSASARLIAMEADLKGRLTLLAGQREKVAVLKARR